MDRPNEERSQAAAETEQAGSCHRGGIPSSSFCETLARVSKLFFRENGCLGRAAADEATREGVIAWIADAAWDWASSAKRAGNKTKTKLQNRDDSDLKEELRFLLPKF